jgi:hypothetical protein
VEFDSRLKIFFFQKRYVWSEDCSHIFEFESVGIFQVALVHTIMLIKTNSRRTETIIFTSDSPSNGRPYQKLLLEANRAGVEMSIINRKQYGYCLPTLPDGSDFTSQRDVLNNLQLEVLGRLFTAI